MTTPDLLKLSRELIEKAAERIHEEAKGPFPVAEDAKQITLADIDRIRLTMSPASALNRKVSGKHHAERSRL